MNLEHETDGILLAENQQVELYQKEKELMAMETVTKPLDKLNAPETKAHQRYRVDGKIVPGVTTIIGSNLGWNTYVLVNWATKLALEGEDPEEHKNRAGRIGTIAHKLIENYIKNEVNKTNLACDLFFYATPEVMAAQTAFKAFLDWEDAYKPTYLHSELQLVSKKYRYGGTSDLICLIGDKRVVLDFKTSTGVYAEHKMQISACGKLWEENNPNKPIDEYHILRVDKFTGEFDHKIIPLQVIDYAWDAFKALLTIHELHKAAYGLR